MKIKSIMLAMAAATALFASAQHQGYKDGIDYFKAGQLENAKEILTKTLDAPETDRAQALYYLGVIELKEGDAAQAAKYFNEGAALNPKCGYNYVGLGAIDLKNGNVKAAEENFKKAVKAEKKAYIFTSIARAYYDIDKINYAKDYYKYLDNARSRDKKDPSIYVLQGDIFRDEALAAGTDDGVAIGKAASEYEMAIHFSPNTPEAYVKYARLYSSVNPKYSIDRLIELNKVVPNSALAQRELAESYYDDNQWTRAAQEYGEYIKNPNHFVKDEERYAVLLYFGERYDESLNIARNILAKDPANPQMQRMLFLNLEKKGDFQGARAAAENFFKTPDVRFTANDYSTYANILNSLEDYDAEILAREKAIEANPDKKELFKDLSAAYTQAGGRANKAEDIATAHANYVKAAEAFQKFIDGGEYGVDYKVQDLVDLGNRYQNAAATSPVDSVSAERADYANKGIAIINRVIEIVPENVVPYRNRARMYLVRGGNEADEETAKAYMVLVEKLDLDPENKTKRLKEYRESFAQIASYYIQAKDVDNAKTWYTKMLDLDPENEALRTYIENLGK